VPSAEDYPPTIVRTDIDGVKVVSDVVQESPLSRHTGDFIPVKGVRILTLEDETTRYACADCVFVAAPERDDQTQTPLGQVRAHRAEKHGVNIGGNRRGRKPAEAPEAPDPAGTVVLPRDTLSMSLLEILNLAGHIDTWSTVLTGLEEQNERLVGELQVALARARAAERKVTELEKAAEREKANLQRRIAKAMGLTIVSTDDEEK